MTSEELEQLLNKLIEKGEGPLIEFKETDQLKPKEHLEVLGVNVSALSNSACLNGADKAWLIFGVSDDKQKVGTSFRIGKGEIEQIPIQLKNHLDPFNALKATHLILLGTNSRAFDLLHPYSPKMVWKRADKDKVYMFFEPPFLISANRLYEKIDNHEIEIFPSSSILPLKIPKYDKHTIYEALNNCIAHQDYGLDSRITVVEYKDKLIFENAGSFFEGSPDEYYLHDHIPKNYRNTILAHAMHEFNMIDSMGYGIQKMFRNMAERFFPLPDFDIDSHSVKLTIHGKILDKGYTQLLCEHTNLSPVEILMLDRIQKRAPIPDEHAKLLRQKGLIEGRKPNYHVSARIAAITGKKKEYMNARGEDDSFHYYWVIRFLQEFPRSTRKELDDLLWDKLSDQLTYEQKRNKISNLISSMSKKGVIVNRGTKASPEWEIDPGFQIEEEDESN